MCNTADLIEGNYYDFTLIDGTILTNFYIAEIVGEWILGSSVNFRVEETVQRNNEQEPFVRGEAINQSIIIECEPNQYNQIEPIN